MEAQDIKQNCLRLAADLLMANNHAAFAKDDAKKLTAEEVTETAEKLYSWIKS